MARARTPAAALLLALLGSSSAIRMPQQPPACDQEGVAFAKLTSATCTINWSLKKDPKIASMAQISQIGCWKLRGYNTDKFLSSSVYQNQQDGKCALVFSGYHGALAGYSRGTAALVWPPETWNLCGHDMYAPYVRLMRHHTALGNWSKLINILAGPQSACKGEPVFAAESMGGTAGEMLAACANKGEQHELMAKGLPNFTLQTLYTFGSPAGSLKPVANSLRKDGCFKGKRIYLSKDPVAQFGAIFNLKHPRMDAIELWESATEKPVVKLSACSSAEAVEDGRHQKPPPINTTVPFGTKYDPIQHEVTTYATLMRWFDAAGKGDLFDEALVEDTTADRYLQHLQKAL